MEPRFARPLRFTAVPPPAAAPRICAARAARTVLAALAALLLPIGAAAAQGAWILELIVDGAPAPWSVEPPAERRGDTLATPAGSERALLRFPGGQLDVNLADLGVWDEAHVLAVAFRPDGERWRVDATVRHADAGWEHYADLWRVVPDGDAGRVENGVRELLHPHDSEQPFTRSQGGVSASGRVWIEARDSVHGFGGSRIGLDLDAAAPPREVRWRLVAGSEADPP